MQSRSLARLSRQGFEGGLTVSERGQRGVRMQRQLSRLNVRATPLSPREHSIARFSQCAGDVFGNALPLLFNFWVKLRRVGFARHRLPNVPHDTTPPITAQEHRPVAIVGDWEAESNSRIRYENSVHANWMCAGSFWCGAAKMLRFQCGATVHFEVHSALVSPEVPQETAGGLASGQSPNRRSAAMQKSTCAQFATLPRWRPQNLYGQGWCSSTGRKNR